MAEPDAKGTAASGASAGPAKAPKPQNPVFRMMGALQLFTSSCLIVY